MRRAAAAACLAGTIVPLAWAGGDASIKPSSIADAKLAMPANAYKHLFGQPVRKDVLRYPKNDWRLVFTKRKIAVYFTPHARAFVISTWNRRDKTAAGIGPCSSINQLKAAYGRSLKPSEPNTLGNRIYAYTVGKLIFWRQVTHPNGPPNNHVTSVGLYSGPLNVASFLAGLSETSALHCS
jgi:hypothetical protein